MIRITKKVLSLLSRGQKKKLIVIMFMMLVGALLDSLGVSLILPLVNSIMENEGWNTTWYAGFICSLFGIQTQPAYIRVLLLLLIFIFIAKDVYLLLEYYVQYSYIARNRHRMQKQLMKQYMHKPYTFFLGSSSGEIMRIIVNDTTMTSSLLISLLQFYMELIVGVVLAITIFIINPLIAFVLMVTLLLELFLIANIMKPMIKRLSRKFLHGRSLVNKWILQALQGIKSIKVSHTEGFFEEKYNIYALEVAEAERKNQTYNKIPQLFIEAFTIAVMLGVVLILLMNGTELTGVLPALSALVIAAMRLLPSINKITTGINTVIYNEPALDNVIKNLHVGDASADTGTEVYTTPGKSPTISFGDRICLKDITFSYPGSKIKILENANMEILSGQSVGIIGASGAGKTTAIDIILGLLKPQQGHVLVDGVDIEQNMESWLAHLAYIPQQIFLMDDTIKANVAFGLDEAGIDESKIWDALREAQLEQFIRTLPDGIETTIGEAGIRLSGGQRQRIGIARALYHEPDILFFDEATSALDGETEAAIMESINHLKGKKTLVIIAHRLTTIEHCDVVYKVEGGQIMCSGNGFSINCNKVSECHDKKC